MRFVDYGVVYAVSGMQIGFKLKVTYGTETDANTTTWSITDLSHAGVPFMVRKCIP